MPQHIESRNTGPQNTDHIRVTHAGSNQTLFFKPSNQPLASDSVATGADAGSAVVVSANASKRARDGRVCSTSPSHSKSSIAMRPPS